MEDLKEIARLILLQVDHNRNVGKDDSFTIDEIADIMKRRLGEENMDCPHSSTSSWGRLVTCLECGQEWIGDD